MITRVAREPARNLHRYAVGHKPAPEVSPLTRTHLIAALQALLVTFLWSTSWVLIKVGLEDIPPITFAGLRYGLAFLVLLPFALHSHSLYGLTMGQWRSLLLLGIVMYARQLTPLTVTVVSMGLGSLLLLGSGAALQGIPSLSATSWGIVGWLAVVNTALAFTLWNHTLRTLSAMESSIINNTMLIQIAVLAWLFLGESLGGKEISGLTLAAVGTLAVQLLGGRARRARARAAGAGG